MLASLKPSMALSAMRNSIQTGRAKNAAVRPVCAQTTSNAPSTHDMTAAATVTALALIPAAANRRTTGRSKAWKGAFSA